MEKKFTLIAFIDGSSHTLTLCEYAALLAKSSDAMIKLYHVLETSIEPDETDWSGAINLGARTKLMDVLVSAGEKKSKAALLEGRKILEKSKGKLEELGCSNVELRLRTGDIADSLKNKEAGGDVILIGKRGEKTSEKKNKIGDNFERIVRASTKPIFVANSNFSAIKHVLVAYDGSIPSRRVLEYLLGNSVFGKLTFSILVVSKESKDWLEREQKPSIMKLNKNNSVINFIGATGDPKEQIIRHVKNTKCEMLAIGAYGHSKFRNIFIGSTTTALIHASPVPVFLSK